MVLLKAPKKRRPPSKKPIVVPFTVIIDDREKAPYLFQGFKAGSKKNYAPLVVPWEWGHLETGDYSIKGYEGRIAIERKSLEDLYNTLAQHRDRFEREHARMAKMDFAGVVIEASWKDIMTNPPPRSGLDPNSIYGTWRSWQIRFGVWWHPMGGRREGEKTTFDLLETWWRENAGPREH